MTERAQIEAAKLSVQTSKEQLSSAREQLKISKVQLEENLRQIAEARSQITSRKRIPFTPRKERLSKLKFKRELSAADIEMADLQKQIAEQEKYLAEKEAELLAYERDILLPAEQQLNAYEKEVAAIETAKKLYEKKANPIYVKGTPEYKYLQQLYANEAAAKKQFAHDVEKFQTENPTEKLIIDWNKLKVVGVDSGAFNMSFTLEDYNKKLEDYQKRFEQSQKTYTLPEELAKQDIFPKDSVTTMDYNIPKVPTGLDLSIKVPGTIYSAGTPYLYKGIPTYPELRIIGEDWSSRPLTKEEMSSINVKKVGLPEGVEFGPKGEVLYSGKASPVDLGIIPAATGALAGIGYSAIDKLLPRQEPSTGWDISGAPRQLGRAGLFALSAAIPGVGLVYAADLIANFIYNPVGTIKSIKQYGKEYPYETYSIALLGGAKAIKTLKNRRAITALKENIKLLDNAKILSVSIIMKNKGFRPNTDRVAVVAEQSIENGIKRYVIEGDLVSQAGNKVYFMPDAKGYSITAIVVKPLKLSKPKIYLETQTFSVGSKSSSFNLGTYADVADLFLKKPYAISEGIANLEVFTPFGKSNVIPESYSYSFTPKKYGLFAEKRFQRAVKKEQKNTYTTFDKEITITKEITTPFYGVGVAVNKITDLLFNPQGKFLTFKVEPKTRLAKYPRKKKTTKTKPFDVVEDLNAKLVTQQKSQVRVTPLALEVSKTTSEITKNIISPKITPGRVDLIGIPRMVGGEGLTEAQLRQYATQQPSMDYYVTGGPLSKQLPRETITFSAAQLLIPQQKYSERQLLQQRNILIERQQLQQKQLTLQRQQELIRQKELFRQKQLQRLKQQQKLASKVIPVDLLLPRTPVQKPTPIPIKLLTKTPETKKIKGKKRKKPSVYNVLPTLSQQIIGYRGTKPIFSPKGFEVLRII